ncbi:hypothetical protein TH53_12785 [Pedobacter lusitanus]|uniref:HNH endonuclease 5 domain-containing protein n=1 Tax=Pedobacter lusitanus TaxID=1503925 RepID=A0A0D0GHQ9_9SPHI|nr:HNH endonuclease [Pedobacter lusitanus]KIO76792.1 hypothetical protein TH53_12785 [Pedobacter lusitanus]
MVTEEYYKTNRDQFTTEPKFNHYEHIIQNALFGRLKPNNILCKQCGNDASTDIDKDFVTLFHFITETIKHVLIKKDHGKGSVNTMKGVLFDKELARKRDIMIRDNIVAPKEPFYDYDATNSILTIYATKVRAKQYTSVVREELKEKGIDYDQLKVEFVEDISHLGAVGIFFTEGIENFHQKLTDGFRKIAAGFATYSGVERSQLKNLLEIDGDGKAEFISSGNVFPFVAVGIVDQQIEINRPDIERHYPSHTIILFSQKLAEDVQHLYCYVDLFSTFQYYVLLNDDYKGEMIYQSYHQATAVESKPWTDVRMTRPKYFNIIVDDYQIDTSKYKGTTLTEYANFLQDAVDKYTFIPALSLKEQVDRIMDIVMQSYTAAQTEIINTPLVDSLKKLKKTDPIILLQELSAYFEDPEAFQTFRTSFFEDDGSGIGEIMSTPIASSDSFMTKAVMRAYCTMKFNQMSEFVFSNTKDPKK